MASRHRGPRWVREKRRGYNESCYPEKQGYQIWLVGKAKRDASSCGQRKSEQFPFTPPFPPASKVLDNTQESYVDFFRRLFLVAIAILR